MEILDDGTISNIKITETWKDQKIYVGSFLVAWYYWNVGRERSSNKFYKVGLINGICKIKYSEFETEEECKEVCENIVKIFINLLGKS